VLKLLVLLDHLCVNVMLEFLTLFGHFCVNMPLKRITLPIQTSLSVCFRLVPHEASSDIGILYQNPAAISSRK
jgi:hypothetical protein